MNKEQCTSEKISSRTVGIIILPLALFIGFFGALIVPVLGAFFAVPLLILAGVFIAAPQSRVCKLLLGDNAR
ncbi:MAG: hypothetical protein PVG78_14765 [Desulfobacterales bacterium]|jgi:hypothetical protein